MSDNELQQNEPPKSLGEVIQEGTAEAAPAPTLPQETPLTPEEIEARLNEQASSAMPDRELELEEQPEEEVFGDAYVPNTSVTEDLPILDVITPEIEADLKKAPRVLFPNHTDDELSGLYDHVEKKIIAQQPSRVRLVELEQAGHLRPVEVAKGKFIFVTEKERAAMAMIANYRELVRTGHGETLFADGEVWRNAPQVGSDIIAIGKSNFAKSNDPILKMRGALGMSGEFPVPLWASGLHLKLSAPGAIESLKLETSILLEKMDMARDTMGYALSAPAIYTNGPVIDFILQHVLFSTAGTTSPDDLGDLILLTDLEPMAGGAAATVYPDGFTMERPCLKSNGGCGHVTRRKINIRRELMVRWERLTDHQKAFMAKRSGRHDPKTIRNYQSMTRPDISRMVDLGNGYYLRLSVPTLNRYRRLATAWMSRLTNGAKDLIVSNAHREEREVFMQRQSNIALIMAFAPWIDAFIYRETVDAEDQIVISRDVDDPDKQYEADMAMDKELTDLSADGGQTERIVGQIKKFIDDMTVSTFVVPKTKCGGCGKPVTGDELSKHPHVVPVNTIELFFTLLRHKIRNSGK